MSTINAQSDDDHALKCIKQIPRFLLFNSRPGPSLAIFASYKVLLHSIAKDM